MRRWCNNDLLNLFLLYDVVQRFLFFQFHTISSSFCLCTTLCCGRRLWIIFTNFERGCFALGLFFYTTATQRCTRIQNQSITTMRGRSLSAHCKRIFGKVADVYVLVVCQTCQGWFNVPIYVLAIDAFAQLLQRFGDIEAYVRDWILARLYDQRQHLRLQHFLTMYSTQRLHRGQRRQAEQVVRVAVQQHDFWHNVLSAPLDAKCMERLAKGHV